VEGTPAPEAPEAPQVADHPYDQGPPKCAGPKHRRDLHLKNGEDLWPIFRRRSDLYAACMFQKFLMSISYHPLREAAKQLFELYVLFMAKQTRSWIILDCENPQYVDNTFEYI
jgi:hypothetical protein